MKLKEIEEKLFKENYIPNKNILYALLGSINQNIPLLIEGAPGVGKTSLAKTVANMLNIPLFRVQFYEGLTADKILYDYDYQKQLLTIESIKSVLENNLKNKSIEEAIKHVNDIDFYNKDFLIKRPVLNSIMQDSKCVLLLDEVDKSSEEIEYTLLEILDEFSITIPQYGTIKCNEDFKPIVFLTSNNYRDLSDALKRRCNYLYIEEKTHEEMKQIIKAQCMVNEKIATAISKSLIDIKSLNLEQVPSIAEAISWTNYLIENKDEIEDIEASICLLAKNKDDFDMIKKSGIIQKNLENIYD